MISENNFKNSERSSTEILKKFLLLTALYISQGVSAGFVVVALPVLLRLRGESLEVIGWAGLLSWPWVLKFLWGPLVDRFYSPKFGARRTWILPLQLMVSLILFILAVKGKGEALTPLLILIVLMNIATSLLDVATDAYATDMLLPNERGWGNGIQIGGFYVGSIIGGGFFLIFKEWIGTESAFCLLGIAVLLPVWLLKTNHEINRTSIIRTREAGFRKFFERPIAKYALIIIVLLDLGENFGVSMLSPFLVDGGLSSEEIGWLLGTGGMVAGLCGAATAGILLNKLPPYRSLIIFSILQTVGMIGYIIVAKTGIVNITIAGCVIGIQYLVSNMFNVALYTCFMGWTSAKQVATDFSIMACVHNATFLVATPLAGYSVKTFGYTGHFALACLLSFFGISIATRIISNGQLSLMSHEGYQKTEIDTNAVGVKLK